MLTPYRCNFKQHFTQKHGTRYTLFIIQSWYRRIRSADVFEMFLIQSAVLRSSTTRRDLFAHYRAAFNYLRGAFTVNHNVIDNKCIFSKLTSIYSETKGRTIPTHACFHSPSAVDGNLNVRYSSACLVNRAIVLFQL